MRLYLVAAFPVYSDGTFTKFDGGTETVCRQRKLRGDCLGRNGRCVCVCVCMCVCVGVCVCVCEREVMIKLWSVRALRLCVCVCVCVCMPVGILCGSDKIFKRSPLTRFFPPYLCGCVCVCMLLCCRWLKGHPAHVFQTTNKKRRAGDKKSLESLES